ncbi:hypothetical protein [Caballeronia fortuita]|nr:hypothetical protein [Caballeronia fortuita]
MSLELRRFFLMLRITANARADFNALLTVYSLAAAQRAHRFTFRF